MTLLDMEKSESGSNFQTADIDELVRRYHWRRINVARGTRQALFLTRRLLWMADVRGAQAVRRFVDVVGALCLIGISSPLLTFVALAIKLSDGGKVLFWQHRVGLRGKHFCFPKFRSMVPDADNIICTVAHHNHHREGVTFKIKRDPRVTWMGRIIRRLSIDEFPQLWCVLKGDMALVGPRPALPREVTKYRLAQRRRLDVKPGLTCFWQVGGRADLPFSRQLELDVHYIENHNLLLDLKLIALTIPAVLSGRGAY